MPRAGGAGADLDDLIAHRRRACGRRLVPAQARPL